MRQYLPIPDPQRPRLQPLPPRQFLPAHALVVAQFMPTPTCSYPRYPSSRITMRCNSRHCPPPAGPQQSTASLQRPGRDQRASWLAIGDSEIQKNEFGQLAKEPCPKVCLTSQRRWQWRRRRRRQQQQHCAERRCRAKILPKSGPRAPETIKNITSKVWPTHARHVNVDLATYISRVICFPRS